MHLFRCKFSDFNPLGIVCLPIYVLPVEASVDDCFNALKTWLSSYFIEYYLESIEFEDTKCGIKNQLYNRYEGKDNSPF